MSDLSKYGVARHIYRAHRKVGSNNHAVGADWTPIAGDVKISKDGGATANVTNLPVAIAMGNSAIWDYSLTATEMQAAQVIVTIADSATKVVEDDGFVIETYGNASAQHEVDLDAAGGVVTASVAALDTTTRAEPAQGTPAATATLATKIDYLYKSWRNKKTQTASQWNLFNDDAVTVDHKSAYSDDLTTATKGEIASGP